MLIPTKEDVILTEALGAVHVGDSGELSQLKTRDVVDAFRSSRRRVLFLDYGGTLVELEGVYLCIWLFDAVCGSVRSHVCDCCMCVTAACVWLYVCGCMCVAVCGCVWLHVCGIVRPCEALRVAVCVWLCA